MAGGQRPLSVGFFFALGHSTIVFPLGRAGHARGPGDRRCPRGRRLLTSPGDGLIGPAVSGFFLLAIGILNLALLVSIFGILRRMRDGASTNRSWSAARLARFHEPPLRPCDAPDHQALADVSAGLSLRPRLRYRDGDRAPLRRGRGRRERPPLLRDPLPSDPVRGRHDPLRHDRRGVHELRLRLGLLGAHSEGLLQPRRDRPLRVGGALDRDDRADLGARGPPRSHR